MDKIYLSQRNIATLLKKLDSVRAGQASACTIIKNDTIHPVYPQTLRRIAVVATETDERYLPGVSPRLYLSRAALLALLDQIGQQATATILVDGIEVFGIADDQYYADGGATDANAIGDLASAFIRSRGKQK